MFVPVACNGRCELEPPTAHARGCNALSPRIEATVCRKEPSPAFASGCGALVPRSEAALACGKGLRAEAAMREEPDGAGGQVEAQQHNQPAPGWSAQEEDSAWVFLRAELVAGLEHCEVGLGPKRLADRFMEIEAYVERGDSGRIDEQLGDDLDVLLPDLMSLKAKVEYLQESLRRASLQAGEGRCLVQQVLELGVKEGEHEERALEGFKQEVFAFVRRVTGSASGRPEAEAKGSLALLAIVVDEILSQVAEWQTSFADWLALQSQRELGTGADLCSGGVEAAGLRRFDSESGVGRLVDDRWQAGNRGGLQPPFRMAAGLTPHRAMGARGPECLGEAPCAERQSWVEEVSCGPGSGARTGRRHPGAGQA
jgi:hypothetical protein